MKRKKASLLVAGVVAALLVVGTATLITIKSHSGTDQSDGPPSPLGGLLQKMMGVSELKAQMQSMRSVYQAMVSYSQAHQDDLPKTVAELRPYLPAKLARLDDEHWEIPAAGKATPLLNGPDASNGVLLQQKPAQPGKARIIVYADGHIEYKP